jgi:hypothetical protein
VGGVVDASEIRVGGATIVNGSGQLTGAAAYSAGAGLDLNGRTFSIASSGCTAGQVLKWNGTAWYCAADATGGGSGVTAVTASAPLVSSGGTAPLISLSTSGCSSGQVLKFNGASWTCAADSGGSGTVTNVTAGAPLSVANGSTTPSLGIARATATADGYLAATDFATFAGKVSSVGATAPLVSSGGTTPNVSLATAGCSSGQVLTFNGSNWGCAALPITCASKTYGGTGLGTGSPVEFVASCDWGCYIASFEAWGGENLTCTGTSSRHLQVKYVDLMNTVPEGPYTTANFTVVTDSSVCRGTNACHGTGTARAGRYTPILSVSFSAASAEGSNCLTNKLTVNCARYP